jgi:filamentous hemagglutinin family protein
MRSYYLHLISLIMTLFTIVNSSAEVILDGSFGSHDSLTGPQFDIRAELGNQVGTNLFHSFERFNLDVGEIATFSGPNHLENIISRVTGGIPSTLDGTIRSTIPQADMYFINPAGIVFGESAKIDVPGAMHFSTADVLQLGETGQFAATHPQTSLLTTATPTAFGFLNTSPRSITIQGSQLSVTQGNTLSLSGGDLELTQKSQLTAVEGQINFASVASPGLVSLTSGGFKLDDTIKTGHLTLNDSQLDVSGQGLGSIFIQAGQVELDSSKLLSNPKGDKIGGPIHIKATDLTLTNTHISSSTDGSGQSGEVILDMANTVTLAGEGIFSNTRSQQSPAGNAGKITITAKQLFLTDEAQISSSTFGPGKGGEIDIQASEAVVLADNTLVATNSESESESISGNAGKITITTQDLTLTQGAQMASATFGNGQGGSIAINTGGTLSIEGYFPGDEEFPIYPSGISVSAFGNGNAGAIELTTKQLQLQEGGAIGSSTYGAGQGDNITLTALESVNITGAAKVTLFGVEYTRSSQIESASEAGANQAGHIVINTPLLILTDSGKITTSAQTATAGKIELQVGQLKLDNQAAITSESAGEGEAGQIRINASEQIKVNHAKISTEAAQAAGGHISITVPQLLALQAGGTITTSVQGGVGGGGDITITKPTLLILNQAKIKANAHGGNGGNITIKADQYLRSVDSSVTASSQLGTPGEIRITALNTNIGGTLVILPATFLDASVLLKSVCESQTAGKQSHFVVKTLTGTPPSPDDWKSNRLLAATTSNQAADSSTQSATNSTLTFPAIVVAIACPDSAKLTSAAKSVSQAVTPTQLF